MKTTTRVGALGLFTLAAATGCGAAGGGDEGARGGGTGGGAPTARSMASTPAAEARVASLRERFQVRPVANAALAMPRLPGMPSEPAPGPHVVIGEDVARGFVATATGLRPLVPPEVKRKGMKSATVELPLRATDPVTLEDDTTGMRVRFSLKGARDVAAEAAGGIAVYPGAIGGADLVHRVHAEGTEDFVVFETRPEREEIAYEVDVSRVAGLRLVSNTLEFLDEGGAPRLRVAPPYVVDARRVRRDATIGVDGCAVDRNPAGPWGRAVTNAESGTCIVTVRWQAVTYPALLDPSWGAVGTMAQARAGHTATVLASGKVLIAAGADYGTLASAELFMGGGFAATGPLAIGRVYHTAVALASGAVLVAGGYGASGGMASAELYDPVTGKFSPTGALSTTRWQHTATVLPSGKVLVTGGYGPNSPLLSTELFDVGTGKFAPSGPMTDARAAHTATLLASGTVLVAGGSGNNGSLAGCELFHPAQATFSLTGSLATARSTHSATLVGPTRVVVAGGGGANGALSTAELYDDTVGTFAAAGVLSVC